MVSQYLIGAAFVLAGVNAIDYKFNGEDGKAKFEPALIAKDSHYEPRKDVEKYDWEEVKKTYSCCEKYPTLFMFTSKDKHHVTCTKTEYKKDDTFEIEGGKWTLNEVEVTEIKDFKFDKATHHHKDEFEKLLLSLKESKTELKEAAADKETACAIGTKKEVKKEKKDEKNDDKKEEVDYEWKYTIVSQKDHSIGKEMTIVKIFGKEYLSFCGTDKDVKEKVLKYTKKDAESCCSCAWYVWVIVAVVIVGAGVGAYFVLKEDKEEDEYEAEYGTA